MHLHLNFMWLCLLPSSDWLQLNSFSQLVLRTKLVLCQAGGDGRIQSLFQVLTPAAKSPSKQLPLGCHRLVQVFGRIWTTFPGTAFGAEQEFVSGRAGCVLSTSNQRDPQCQIQPAWAQPLSPRSSWFITRNCAVLLAFHTRSEANVIPSRPVFKDALWTGGAYLKLVDVF